MQTSLRIPSPAAVAFALTIFLGAFLLFQVQPLIGRFLLPWFGGTPDVWTTSLLFFQTFLLVGYTYAHVLSQLRSPGLQRAIHVGLLAVALAMLPIVPRQPVALGTIPPGLAVLWICVATVGLPYALLSATSPLMQRWYAATFPSRNPYRLYALSNVGSLLALVSFPVLVEPILSRVQSAALWSIGFASFAVVCAGATIMGTRVRTTTQADETAAPSAPRAGPSTGRRLLWIGLPACASLELLAVTNAITQDVPVIPFLWILPLAIYLVSFILCFDHEGWYRRNVFVPLFMLGILGVVIARVIGVEEHSITTYIAVHLFMLFGCSMVCHGEVYRIRPGVARLTAYYLSVAAGGAVGGFAVAVVAPLVFSTYVELYVGLGVTAVLVAAGQPPTSRVHRVRRRYAIMGLILASLGAGGVLGKRGDAVRQVIDTSRNFYGVLTVWEQDQNDLAQHRRLMQHGTTYHGLQFQAPNKRLLPTAYYGRTSGVGLVVDRLPTHAPRHIGVIGLGVGTIATYGRTGDTIRFYEINPDVERLAREYFSYLSDSPAEIDVVLGDARLSMAAEAPRRYDVLVLDAFSSDAVPVHLLTREAMAVYLRHLAPEGVLAFHLSSLHLDLNAVVWELADAFELATAWIENPADPDRGVLASSWILLAADDEVLGADAIQRIASWPSPARRRVSVWTDDHVNLFEILKGRSRSASE